MGFVATGVAGLVITSAVVAVSTHWFHLDPRIGKLLDVGISFFTVYLMRSRFVFGDSAK
jgi:putative flippase GtrA